MEQGRGYSGLVAENASPQLWQQLGERATDKREEGAEPMQFTHDLEALKQAFTQQDTQLSRLKEVLEALDPRLGLPFDPGALDAIGEALVVPPVTHASAAMPRWGTRA